MFFQAGPLRVELAHVKHLYAPGFTQKYMLHPEKSVQRQNYLTYLLAAIVTKKKIYIKLIPKVDTLFHH
jgi:hypothetical protein